MPTERALAHQLERAFGQADQSHAVVDAARPQPSLSDLEAPALAKQDVLCRHPNVLEHDLAVAMRRIVIPEHRQGAQQLHAGRVHRHQDHRLPQVRARVIGLALPHHDQDPAARIVGARAPPLAAIDDVRVAVAFDARADLGGVRRGHLGLGHGEAAADLAGQQRLKPLGLLRGRAVALQHLHVAGVGRAAVEHLGRDRRSPHQLAQRRVLGIGEARAARGLGQEQIPQPSGPGLGLERLDHAGRHPGVAGAAIRLDLVDEGGLIRIHLGLQEGLDAGQQVFRTLRVLEVHQGASFCAMAQASSASGTACRPISAPLLDAALPARARASTPCRIAASRNRLKTR